MTEEENKNNINNALLDILAEMEEGYIELSKAVLGKTIQPHEFNDRTLNQLINELVAAMNAHDKFEKWFQKNFFKLSVFLTAAVGIGFGMGFYAALRNMIGNFGAIGVGIGVGCEYVRCRLMGHVTEDGAEK